MTEWLMRNLPGMFLNSVVESFVVTLLVYFLCAVFFLYKGMSGVRGWHVLAVFVCVLFVQGALNLFVQVLFPSTEPLGVSMLLRVLICPVVLSWIALLTLKNRVAELSAYSCK